MKYFLSRRLRREPPAGGPVSAPRAPRNRPIRWTRVCGAGGACALLVAAALLLASPASVLALLPDGGAIELARERWVPPLLGENLGKRLEALAEMRRHPELARQALLVAIGDPGRVPRRWRLIHHLAEFGRMEDIPPLLARLEFVEDALERRIGTGTARGLYPAFAEGADLTGAVTDFVFIQTGPATPHDEEHDNTLPMDRGVFEAYHRAELPIELIAALRGLRGKSYTSRERLAAALEKALPERDWERWRKALLAPVEPLPPRVQLVGLLRVRVYNPTERPLLVRIGYGIWHGRFREPPEPAYLYVEPGAEARHDQEVRIAAVLSEVPIRVDLRLREVHQPPQPLYRKLYIPLLP